MVNSDIKRKGIFITATDTDVGKSVAVAVLGVLLQEQGLSVGVLKPVQCGGEDSKFLKRTLNLKDSLKSINPFYAPEPLSPHLAFERKEVKFDKKRIKRVYKEMSEKYDFVLVEGAGGIMVPIKGTYLVGDLIKDLDLECIIVTRLGLGTINHTLLTIDHVWQKGINVLGVLFNTKTVNRHSEFVYGSNKSASVVEKTNPDVIRTLGKVDVLGTIPYFKSLKRDFIIKVSQKSLDTNMLCQKLLG